MWNSNYADDCHTSSLVTQQPKMPENKSLSPRKVLQSGVGHWLGNMLPCHKNQLLSASWTMVGHPTTVGASSLGSRLRERTLWASVFCLMSQPGSVDFLFYMKSNLLHLSTSRATVANERSTVVSWYPRGICSRTYCGHPTLWKLRPGSPPPRFHNCGAKQPWIV